MPALICLFFLASHAMVGRLNKAMTHYGYQNRLLTRKMNLLPPCRFLIQRKCEWYFHLAATERIMLFTKFEPTCGNTKNFMQLSDDPHTVRDLIMDFDSPLPKVVLLSEEDWCNIPIEDIFNIGVEAFVIMNTFEPKVQNKT